MTNPTTDTMELAREVCGCAWCRGDIPRQPRECHFTHAVAAITEAVGRERERIEAELWGAHTDAVQRRNATTDDHDPSKPHPLSAEYRDGLKDGVEHCISLVRDTEHTGGGGP